MAIANELNVTQTQDATVLAQTIFGDGVTIVSSTITGTAGQSGTYTGGDTTSPGTVPSDAGVIFSTGVVSDYTNSSGTTDTNTAAGTGTDHSGAGDADLDGIAGVATLDAVIFETVFIADNDVLTMQLTFSSEEYLEYVNGGVNDAVGVWVNGTFTPLTPSGDTVSIDTVNNVSNSNLYIDNPADTDPYNTEMDGFTITLSFKAPVNVGVENTIKIGLADGGDGVYDSNILIAADSGQTVALAITDNFEVAQNGSAVIDVLENDFDDAGLGLTVTQINGVDVVVGDSVTLNTGEIVTLNPDGTLTVLADNDLGTNSFTYQVTDGNGVTDIGYVNLETVGAPSPDGYVDGSAGNDVIDVAYTGDPNGDLVDANDSQGVEGTSGDGDVIRAYGGDDTVNAGDGDDIVYGGTGDDTISGGAGADTLFGGDDADTFFGGEGDTVVGGEGGNDNDTLDLSTAGPTRIIYDENDPESGTVEFLDGSGNVTGTMTFSEIENVNFVPCFTSGTKILTIRGEVLVERLRVGDRVMTRDNGPQKIRWIGTRALPAAVLASNPELRPVRIPANSFGPSEPEQDTMVSPNHRMLMTGHFIEMNFGEDEVLVPAKHLVGMGDIDYVEDDDLTYVHIMFDRHEIVCGDGTWSESFQPGDQSIASLACDQREELFAIFPDLRVNKRPNAYTAARLSLKRFEAQMLH